MHDLLFFQSFLFSTVSKKLVTAALVLALGSIGYSQVSFSSNGQQLNSCSGRSVIIGDFNGDGNPDAFVINSDNYRVYFGDGRGQFTDSGQRLSSASRWTSPAAGDINGDGRLEVITGRTIWLNDGSGRMTAQINAIPLAEGEDLTCVKLADLNGDGYLDIFALCNFSSILVFQNDGKGNFRDSGKRLGGAGVFGKGQLAHIVLGDIDGNGTIDAITTGWKWDGSTECPNRVWINDGKGNFHDSGQLLDEGASHVHGLALGDLNGDGRPDLVMGIQDRNRSGRIFINDGKGRFVGGADLPAAGGENLVLADFDGNGALDIFAAHSSPPNRVWLNDGKGNFVDSTLRLGPSSSWNWDVGVGDFNKDGKPDVFIVAAQRSNISRPAAAQIWLNTSSATPAPLPVPPPEPASQAKPVTPAPAAIPNTPAAAAVPASQEEPVVCGVSRKIQSAILNESRTLHIRLPRNYAKGDKRFPVLYKLDGSKDVFIQAVASVEYLSDWKQAQDHIVVGIQNTNRNRDMNPEQGARNFLRFLTEELVPFINAEYRTSETRILCGQSFSSIFATYACLEAPHIFNAYVLSSFGLSEEWKRLFEEKIQEHTKKIKAPLFIYTANARVDSYDADGSRTRRGTAFLEALKTADAASLNLEIRVFDDQGHVPYPTIHYALRWMAEQERKNSK